MSHLNTFNNKYSCLIIPIDDLSGWKCNTKENLNISRQRVMLPRDIFSTCIHTYIIEFMKRAALIVDNSPRNDSLIILKYMVYNER